MILVNTLSRDDARACMSNGYLWSAGTASQLAAVAASSGPEKENLAESASAIVTAALRLQPLLARAQKLRAKDTTALRHNDKTDGKQAMQALNKEILKNPTHPEYRLPSVAHDLRHRYLRHQLQAGLIVMQLVF